jgi:MFS family permease
LLSLSQILILILATVAPGYASQILGIPIEKFPIIFITPAALGMVIGAIILVNLSHNQPKEKLMTAGIIISGIAILTLPFCSKVASRDIIHTLNLYLPQAFEITIYHIMALIAFLLGIANSFLFVPANTYIQEHAPEDVRGKVYGLLNTLIGIMSLLPIILVGGLSDIIGVGAVITGIGVCLLLLGVLNIFIARYFLR